MFSKENLLCTIITVKCILNSVKFVSLRASVKLSNKVRSSAGEWKNVRQSRYIERLHSYVKYTIYEPTNVSLSNRLVSFRRPRPEMTTVGRTGQSQHGEQGGVYKAADVPFIRQRYNDEESCRGAVGHKWG